MNHRTPAENFRARLMAMSRPQLEEAMRYLHIVDPGVVERALQFAALPVTVEHPAPVAVSLAYCMAARDFGDGFTALCDRLDKHREHRAPGRHDGDPDIRWTDEALVYAGDFGATIAEDGA